MSAATLLSSAPCVRTGPVRLTPRPSELARMDVDELYAAFVLPDLVRPGELTLEFTDLDRLVTGAAMPLAEPLVLPAHAETGTDGFLDRRELGALNIGGPGAVEIDGERFALENGDAVYAGCGTGEVVFTSDDPENPAVCFLLSCPAHRPIPAARITRDDARVLELGDPLAANRRTIRQYIHAEGQSSCQLVMGYTELAPGNVWNTFPPHTHLRRSEIYFYFNLQNRLVTHFCGEPTATRHVFLRDRQAVLSPPWSVHAGCGQGAYCFIWGMAGENQTFTDMDAAPLATLR